VRRCRLGGLELDALSPDEAVAAVVALVRKRTPALVVTSHIHHLWLAERDGAFRDVLAGATYNFADGWPIVAASRLLGTPLPGRVAGIDLVARVLAGAEGARVAILGGAPGAAEALAARTRDVVLVDPLPPPLDDTALDAAVAAVRDAQPELVLVGLGAPRQELLAQRLVEVARGPVIGCGAAIEVLGGLRPRAPKAFQLVGLEWAFRMALEPRRLLPRYAGDGANFCRVLARELVARRSR
jgi:N-acetylglucosaminyldiphosphoundecaprenol N-acetyl-beta-D-mannosaminyltransferase